MKRYKYRGKTAVLGRFGEVKKGATVTLTEQEAYKVDHQVDNTEFLSLREAAPEGFPEQPGLPPTGGSFDLSGLRWKTPALFKDVRRLRRAKLLHSLGQLEALGFPIPRVDHRTDQEEMRDILLTTARFAGWI